MTAAEIATRLQASPLSTGGWKAHCPAHDDRKESLTISEGEDGRTLLYCHAGCSFDAIVRALGVRPAELCGGKAEAGAAREPAKRTKTPKVCRQEPTYVYYDENRRVRFGVIRTPEKKFFQVRRGSDGLWYYGLGDVEPCLYKLPELIEAVAAGKCVFVVEGEKDVDNLVEYGIAATTSPMGAGKWRPEYARYFKGADVVLIPDNDDPGRAHMTDVAQSLFGVAASIRWLELEGLPPKGDVSDWLWEHGSPDDLLELAEVAPPWEPAEEDAGDEVAEEEAPEEAHEVAEEAAPEEDRQRSKQAGPYLAHGGRLWHRKDTKEGPVSVPLTNFDAWIVEELVRDDGAEQTTVFALDGRLDDGRSLGRAIVPAAKFPAMTWVAEVWGARPVVNAGHGTKDHVRAAIQLLSGDVPRRTEYTHLGWRRIDGVWAYLHAGGAIGPDGPVAGVDVEPGEGNLTRYELPEPPEGAELVECVRASLTYLDLAPRRISVPVLATVYRAPLIEAVPADFAPFLVGRTGVHKSEMAAMAQAHYGARFTSRTLPANWTDTANALEKFAFLAKDAVLVVDDFAPGGTQAEIERYHREAGRLFRAQGNLAGRGRMRPDGSLRMSYYPRGIVCSTGEEVPRGHSIRARLFVLEVSPGDVDLVRLTTVQEMAAEGLLARALSAYVRWVAGRMDDFKRELPRLHRERRAEAREQGARHARTPDITASLQIGWETFLDFALDVGAISEEERAELYAAGGQALWEAAATQGAHQIGEEPVGRFLALIGSALTSGRAHVADIETGDQPPDASAWGWRLERVGTGAYTEARWRPLGDLIGWIDEDDVVYLDPDAAYAVAQRLGQAQGVTLPVGQRTLWKRMAERGLLCGATGDRNLVKKTTPGGVRLNLLAIPARGIWEGEEG